MTDRTPRDRSRRLAGLAVAAAALATVAFALPAPYVPPYVSALWGGLPPQAPQSRFSRHFRLHEAVERSGAPQLQAFLGDGGSGMSRVGERSDVVSYREEREQTYRLIDAGGAPFDEAAFLRRLQTEVLKAARAADVWVQGEGSAEGAFHFEYVDHRHRGTVQVTGKHAEDGTYVVWSLIAETAW